MKIDAKAIEDELRQLANPTPDHGEKTGYKPPQVKVIVKLDTKMDVATSTRETEAGYFIRLNPKRFNGQKKLEEHLTELRKMVVS